jgi:hypothetical protein
MEVPQLQSRNWSRRISRHVEDHVSSLTIVVRNVIHSFTGVERVTADTFVERVQQIGEKTYRKRLSAPVYRHAPFPWSGLVCRGVLAFEDGALDVILVWTCKRP